MEYYSMTLGQNEYYIIFAGMMLLSNWCSASEFHYEDEMVTPGHSQSRQRADIQPPMCLNTPTTMRQL